MNNILINSGYKIYKIRGERVMLDSDLSSLYGVKTYHLNERVKRNIKRFPPDFMLQLTKQEYAELKSLTSQIAISSWGGRRALPYVFTEQGVAMLSSVLGSDLAIEINIKIMRAFIEIRKSISEAPEYESLKQTVKQIESRMDAIEANHVVDNTRVSAKMVALSRDVRRFSEILDEFQGAHIVIKRPDA